MIRRILRLLFAPLIVVGSPAHSQSLFGKSLSGGRAPTVRISLGTVGPGVEYDDMVTGEGGTITSTAFPGSSYPHGFARHHIYIGADNLTFDSSMAGRQLAMGSSVEYNFGGGVATGARAGLGVFASLQAPMAGTDQQFYGALYPFAQASVNNGGTNSVSRGNIYAVNPQCQLAPGATYFTTIVCNETDVEVDTGASVQYKFGENVTTIGSDAVHGSVREAAYHVGAVPSTGGWNYGLLFSDYSGGGVPISTTGTLVGSMGSVGTIGNGIDLRGFSIGGLAFASAGFSVYGTGQIKNVNGQEYAPAEAPGVAAGRFYYGVDAGATSSQIVSTLANAWCAPLLVPARTTYTKLGVNIAAAVAGSQVEMAIYNTSVGIPAGAPLVTTSALSAAAAGDVEATISQTLSSGTYLACVSGTSNSIGLTGYLEGAAQRLFGSTTSGGGETSPYFPMSGFGAWPTVATTLSYLANGGVEPKIWVRE